ncbi:MAG: hypothetical protein KDA21_13785, partial [Phycisphaerales bacterium]|nr:hypothetical protein [Phycisphaerales bacterium]
DHYWVFAHVTPTLDQRGRITGYHSSRRKPSRQAVGEIQKVYAELLREERRHRTPKEQWAASLPLLVKFLEEKNVSYDEWVFSLARAA